VDDDSDRDAHDHSEPGQAQVQNQDDRELASGLTEDKQVPTPIGPNDKDLNHVVIDAMDGTKTSTSTRWTFETGRRCHTQRQQAFSIVLQKINGTALQTWWT
jgi:hypothetical protein